ncbi:MAG: MFS transporter [Silvibacterium sp.]|nr:MFS transporter [Silvibacterium sp.]
MAATGPALTADAPMPPIGRTALRKATWRLIPLIALGYGTAYMDRVNISFAALQMNLDLHFTATTYGLGAGLFFLSYSACEVPSNLLLCRFGARRWLSRIMITWGVLAIAMMFVRTPLQFYVVRFLLGMAEAGFFPGVVFYLMQWFPPEMRARAVSRFYISLPLSSVVMGVLAGALLNLNGRLGLAGWQWLFLIEGLPAVLLSVAFWVLLPDGPGDARWLTADERAWVLEQIRVDACSGGHTHDVWRALRDPRVLLLGLINLCMLGYNYAYTFSAPAILIRLTGWSPTKVGFLIAVMNLLAAAGMILNALHSDRSRERYWHAAIPFAVISVGYLVGGLSVSAWLAVPALGTVVIAHSALQGPLLSIPSMFLKGKGMAAGIAAMNTIGILGGFLGPYWMGVAKDLTGDYLHGLLTLTVPALAAAGMVLWLRRAQRPALAAC